MVTGVRGTSVDIRKIGIGNAATYMINTVSSANTLNKLQRISYNSGKRYDPVTNAYGFGSGTFLTYLTGADVSQVNRTVQSSAFSYVDSWIRNNTISDIDYLSKLLSGNTGIDTTRINTELDNTLVQGDPLTTQAMLIGSIPAYTSTDIITAASLLDADTTWDNKNNAKALKCKRQ